MSVCTQSEEDQVTEKQLEGGRLGVMLVEMKNASGHLKQEIEAEFSVKGSRTSPL